MKHFILFILFLCSSWTILFAGTPIDIPDMGKIEAAVRNSQSPYYYPDLMKKFHSNDTTMTLQEFRHLYLGYVFQEDYNPYRSTHIPANIEQLYERTSPSVTECDSLIKYAHKVLNNTPFDLRQMKILSVALQQKGEQHEAAVWEYRLNGIVQAILSTGDGKSPETAWFVIFPAEEYSIINRQGFTGAEYTFVEPYFDYIAVEKNPLKTEGFYFNVKSMLKEYSRKHYE